MGVILRPETKIRYDDVSQVRLFAKDGRPCEVAVSAGELAVFERAAKALRLRCQPPPRRRRRPSASFTTLSLLQASMQSADYPPPPTASTPIPATETAPVAAPGPRLISAPAVHQERKRDEEDKLLPGCIKVSAITAALKCDHIEYSLCMRSSFVSPSTGAEAAASAHVVSTVSRVCAYVASISMDQSFILNDGLLHTQRFTYVHALHQTLLHCPATKTAAMALAPLAPRKTYTWSALMTSDVSNATARRRVVEIPCYINAVLASPKMSVRKWGT